MYLATETTKIKLRTDEIEEKDIKIVIVIVFHMFKKFEIRLSMLSRDTEDVIKTNFDF